jgi:hypothetical protein
MEICCYREPITPVAASTIQKTVDWLVEWGCGTCVGLLVADVVIGSFNAQISSFKPSIFTVGVLMLCLCLCALSKPRFSLVGIAVLTLPVVRWLDIVVFGGYSATSAADSDVYMMTCARAIMVAVAILAVLSTPAGMKAMRWAAIVSIIMSSGSVVVEFLGFVKFTPIAGRFAGFHGYPNTAPIMACGSLGVLFALNPSFRFNCLMIALAVPGIALTYSRSGLLVNAALIAIYVIVEGRKNLGFLALAACIVVPVAGAGYAVLVESSGSGVLRDKNTSDRLEAVVGLDTSKLESPERYREFHEAWEGVMLDPVLGQGVGSASTRWAPHNEYIYMLLELGIPGLLLFITIMWGIGIKCVLSRGRAVTVIFGLLLFSPIAQERMTDPYFFFPLLTAVHLLWEHRIAIVFRRPAKQIAPGHLAESHVGFHSPQNSTR